MPKTIATVPAAMTVDLRVYLFGVREKARKVVLLFNSSCGSLIRRQAKLNMLSKCALSLPRPCEQVAVVKTFQGKFYTLFALRRSNSRKYVKNVQVSSWELVNGVSEGNNCDTITLSCFRAGSL